MTRAGSRVGQVKYVPCPTAAAGARSRDPHGFLEGPQMPDQFESTIRVGDPPTRVRAIQIVLDRRRRNVRTPRTEDAQDAIARQPNNNGRAWRAKS